MARPWIVVRRLVLRSGGVAGRLLLLLVAATSTTAAAGPLLGGTAALPLAVVASLAGGVPALAVTRLVALAVSAVRTSGRRAWSGDEGGRRGGGRRIGGPGSLAGGDVIDVDLLEQKKRASLLEGGEGLSHLEVGDHGS